MKNWFNIIYLLLSFNLIIPDPIIITTRDKDLVIIEHHKEDRYNNQLILEKIKTNSNV